MAQTRKAAGLRTRAASHAEHHSHLIDILGRAKIFCRRRMWPAHEIAELSVARIAGKLDEEIRTLVPMLEAAHKAAANRRR